MTELRTILCPTDFSECSDAALRLALELAKRLGARVQLLHVFQVPIYVGWEDGPAALAATTQFLDEARKHAGDELARLQQQHAASGVTIETKQVDGLPQQKIVELGEDADLIVMGTHGRTGLAHVMLGSVAERVVRTATRPVLTVPVGPSTETPQS